MTWKNLAPSRATCTLVVTSLAWGVAACGSDAASSREGDPSGTQTGSDGVGEGDARHLPSCSERWVATDEAPPTAAAGAFAGSATWGEPSRPNGETSPVRLDVDVLGGLFRAAGEELDAQCQSARRVLVRSRFELDGQVLEEERYQYLRSAGDGRLMAEFDGGLPISSALEARVPPIGEFTNAAPCSVSAAEDARGEDAGPPTGTDAGVNAPSLLLRLNPSLGYAPEAGDSWAGALRRQCQISAEPDAGSEAWRRLDVVGVVSLERSP